VRHPLESKKLALQPNQIYVEKKIAADEPVFIKRITTFSADTVQSDEFQLAATENAKDD